MYTTLADFRTSGACSGGTRRALEAIGGSSKHLPEFTRIPFWYPLLVGTGEYSNWILERLPYYHDQEDFAQYYARTCNMVAYACGAIILMHTRYKIYNAINDDSDNRRTGRNSRGTNKTKTEDPVRKLHLDRLLDSKVQFHNWLVDFLAKISETNAVPGGQNSNGLADYLASNGSKLSDFLSYRASDGRNQLTGPAGFFSSYNGKYHFNATDHNVSDPQFSMACYLFGMTLHGDHRVLSVIDQVAYFKITYTNMAHLLRWYHCVDFTLPKQKEPVVASATPDEKPVRGRAPKITAKKAAVRLTSSSSSKTAELRPAIAALGDKLATVYVTMRLRPRNVKIVGGSDPVKSHLEAPEFLTPTQPAPKTKAKTSIKRESNGESKLWRYMMKEAEVDLLKKWVFSCFDVNVFFNQIRFGKETELVAEQSIATAVNNAANGSLIVDRKNTGEFNSAVLVIKDAYMLSQIVTAIKKAGGNWSRTENNVFAANQDAEGIAAEVEIDDEMAEVAYDEDDNDD